MEEGGPKRYYSAGDQILDQLLCLSKCCRLRSPSFEDPGVRNRFIDPIRTSVTFVGQAMAAYFMSASSNLKHCIGGQTGQHSLDEEGPADSTSVEQVQDSWETLRNPAEPSPIPGTLLPRRIKFEVTCDDQGSRLKSKAALVEGGAERWQPLRDAATSAGLRKLVRTGATLLGHEGSFSRPSDACSKTSFRAD